MLVGPTNQVADHEAVLYSDKCIVVTLCHSLTSEEAKVFHKGARNRTEPDNARPAVTDPEASNDSRFKLVELSFAYRMLQLAGIIE